MLTLTFCSLKGGTAKTSRTFHIGACVARYNGKRTLLVDFDSQMNPSIILGIGPDTLDTMVPVLQGQKKVTDVLRSSGVKYLDIIPAKFQSGRLIVRSRSLNLSERWASLKGVKQ